MERPANCLDFKDRNQWRSWLGENYVIATEAWVIITKKKYQGQGLSLNEAVEEALCFGWIDGKLKSLNEKQFVLRFSPRTSKSIWSMSNIRRAEKLLSDGKMINAGRQKIVEAIENGEWEAAIQREQVDKIPDELEKALLKLEGALSAYQALPDSRKKQLMYWLQDAKREETKEKRIQKIIEEVVGD
jgi:uncharacterized protein YdeI (YjbR/CyaY-like superfamily)